MRGLAVSPPRFSKYREIAIPPEFSEKNNWREILVWSPYSHIFSLLLVKHLLSTSALHIGANIIPLPSDE